MMNTLPHGALALSSLEEQMLQPGVKGLPLTAPLRQGAIGVQGWNVLHGDTSLPVAVLKTSALRHNLEWMRDFCERHGVRIAPHGKTTMCPQLFGAQLANGAWGITLANAVQVRVAYRFGVRRVLVANQLVARSDVRMVLQLLHEDPGFEWGHGLEAIATSDSTTGFEVSADDSGRVDVSGHPPIKAIAPEMPVYGPTGQIFQLSPDRGHRLTFRFHRNDLGKARFEGQKLKREGEALLMQRYDTVFRFQKVRP